MTARAIDRTVLTSTTDLTDLQRAQLAVVGKLYFGEGELPQIAEDDSDGDPMETRTLLSCEVWRVVDDGRHIFDAWLYMGDSGTIFEAGTTNKVAEVIQDYLEFDDDAVGAVLKSALGEAKLISVPGPRAAEQPVSVSQPKKKVTAKKATAKKATSKKTPSKRAAAKKASLKKPASKRAMTTRATSKKKAVAKRR